MKLLIALICSVFLHVAWLLVWPLHVSNHANKISASHHKKPFELNITHVQSHHVNPSVLAEKKLSKKITNQTQPTLNAVAQNMVSQVATAEPQKEIREVYLSINEVDIQALPMSNIDASMLPAAMQNSQIKLRLFIDEFGKVVRIEPIKSQLYQDDRLEDALSARLTHISFTPAKRNGVDVKSYQEVAFDFNVSIQLSQANNMP